jgi:hypothetical protein
MQILHNCDSFISAELMNKWFRFQSIFIFKSIEPFLDKNLKNSKFKKILKLKSLSFQGWS